MVDFSPRYGYIAQAQQLAKEIRECLDSCATKLVFLQVSIEEEEGRGGGEEKREMIRGERKRSNDIVRLKRRHCSKPLKCEARRTG